MDGESNQLAGRMVPARKLRPDEDTMRGKTFKHRAGDFKDMNDVVDYTIEENGKYSVIFKSGVKIPVLELNETMMDVNTTPEKVTGLTYDDEPTLDIDDIIPGKIKRMGGQESTQQINYIPPSEPAFGPEDYIGGNLGGNVYNRNQSTQKDPIHDLLGKKKKSNVPVKIEVELDLPSKELYDMLVDTFDGAYESIMNYILSNDGMKYIKLCVQKSLNSYYGYVPLIVEPIVEPAIEPVVEQKLEEPDAE